MIKRGFSQKVFVRYLLKNHLVPLHRVSLALHEQKRIGGTLAGILLQRGYIGEDELNRSIAASMNIPYVELLPEKLDPELVASIPAEILTEHLAVPLFLEDDILHVAFADPTAHRALHDLALFSHRQVMPAVARKKSVLLALDYFLSPSGLGAGEDFRLNGYRPPEDFPGYEEILQDITGTSLVYVHLLEGWWKKAREVHFEPVSEGLRVRYRREDELEVRVLYPSAFREICLDRLRIAAGVLSTGTGEIGRQVFSIFLGGAKRRLSLAYSSTMLGTSAVISFLEYGADMVFDWKRLKSDAAVIKFLERAGRGTGLNVVAGRGREGADPVAETVFRELVSPRLKAVAVQSEEPLEKGEYLLIPVAEGAEVAYRRALLQAARQKPDLLYIDNLELPSILEQILHLGLAGFSLLGKSDFSRSVDFIAYLMECGIKNSLIAAALNSILALRPVRILCPDCREAAPVSAEAKKRRPHLKEISRVFLPRGCDSCSRTGFQGLEWLTEVTVNDNGFKDYILQSRNPWDLRRGWEELKAGESIVAKGLRLLADGRIDPGQFESL